jgi:RecA-family ATPase
LLELPQDLALLEKKIRHRNAKLLIIDPVLTMLGDDANKDQDARKALTPIRDMAERTGVAVIAVRHLNKSIGLKAIQRGGGNMGLIGVARAGSFFAASSSTRGGKRSESGRFLRPP